jgi:hypothetical protein
MEGGRGRYGREMEEEGKDREAGIEKEVGKSC